MTMPGNMSKMEILIIHILNPEKKNRDTTFLGENLDVQNHTFIFVSRGTRCPLLSVMIVEICRHLTFLPQQVKKSCRGVAKMLRVM